MPVECYNIWSIVLTIISILATITLSVVAVWQNSRYKKLSEAKDESRKLELKEENRLKIRPYLFAEFIEDKYTFLANNSNCEFLYFDDLPSNKKAIQIHNRLLPDIEEILSEQDSIALGLKAQKLLRKYLVISYKLRNVGADSAINVLLLCNNAKTYPPFALMAGEIKEINLVFDFDEIDKCDKYEVILEFNFTDVEGNESYMQQTSFYINEDINAADTIYYTSSYCKITAPQRLNLEKSSNL